MIHMGMKQLIRKAAKFILASQPEANVTVNIAQISYGSTLAGKTIVITGGGTGLGLAMARKFIAEGARVHITGRNEDKLRQSAKALGSQCSYTVFDVTDVTDAKRFIEQCSRELGGQIDCFVSNAGVSLHENVFSNVTIDGFDKQFNTNLRAAYFLAQAFLEYKLTHKDNDGQLLFISSESADQCYDIPYGMTKAAINTLTRALSRRVYQQGIRVNAIAPGVTATDMTKEYADVSDGNLSRKCASGRVFLPSEVAEVACFLLSDASQCISGEVIHTNGGNHLRAFWDAVE